MLSFVCLFVYYIFYSYILLLCLSNLHDFLFYFYFQESFLAFSSINIIIYSIFPNGLQIKPPISSRSSFLGLLGNLELTC